MIGHSQAMDGKKKKSLPFLSGDCFWLVGGGPDVMATGAAAVAGGLSGWGWTTTTLSLTAATGADFLSSADVGTPASIAFAADTDLLQSPTIFGDYSHGLAAGEILGRYPTKLICEVYAAFPTNSAEETRTGFGLIEAGGTAGTDVSAMAWIHALATTNAFSLRSGAASDNASSLDSAYHQWRIVVNSADSLVEWFIDGTSQGTIAVQTDLWPCSFGAYASTTNRVALAWIHLWYE